MNMIGMTKILLLAAAFSATADPVHAAIPGISLADSLSGLTEAQEREREAYDRGMKALDASQWDAAIGAFEEVVKAGGATAPGALYWKAYAENRQGRGAEALATLAELGRAFPDSRWLRDARALELEIRGTAGQPVAPEAVADEELKLLAINSLMNSDPERAVPLLEKFLQRPQSTRLQERTLFVLTQTRSERARQLVADIARGRRNPELQMKAVQYLGVHGSQANRQLLSDIYGSATDIEVRRRVLRSFMVAGERARLLAVAREEKVPELRAEAVKQLGVMGAQDELWQLYQSESSAEVKRAILQGMFVGGGAERLLELARTEKDPDLRGRAIRNLGLIGSSRTGAALLEIYNTNRDPAIRRNVLDALFVQNNARGLVDLARQETDPAMKQAIVKKLSIMGSDEARNYMLELLKP